MAVFSYKDKTYRINSQGFLLNPDDWDNDFAEGTAPRVKLPHGLTEEHWKVLYFIRETFQKMKECPLVYVACRRNEIGLGDLQRLFPTGYLRGACKLAGITYAEASFQRQWLEENIELHEHDYEQKVYRINAQGFLIDPSEWDEYFAIHKAYEMKMPEYLTKKHWQIIYFLRQIFEKTGVIPTVYETCETNQIEIEELEKLFPDGYHRGAIKIAGLSVR